LKKWGDALKQAKWIREILSIVLAAAILVCCVTAGVSAQEDSTKKDVSEYPVICIAGGFHRLYVHENTDDMEVVFDTQWIGGILDGISDELLGAIKSLNLDRAVDILKEAVWGWMGPIRMDKSGKSVNQDITCDGPYWLEDYSGEPSYVFDWRLDPIYNADRLEAYLTLLEERHGITKFNLQVVSGSGPIMLAYLKNHGTDRIASMTINNSMHEGTTVFGAAAKRTFHIDMEALSQLGSFQLDSLRLDLSTIHPILAILYQSGLLDLISTLLIKPAAQDLLARIYDEIVLPLLATMPAFWSYLPPQDVEAAKAAMFKGNLEYADLIEQIDGYQKIAAEADGLIRKAAAKIKVAVWAGYGQPLVPLVEGAAIQSDFVVDTKYASLGATCAPVGMPFFPACKQREKCCGRDHISPDRLVDASTCLLPDQTWFAKYKPHNSETWYSGWYEWFLSTDNPTVFGDEQRFPQFMEYTQDGAFVPLTEAIESEAELILRNLGLWILKLWRWLLLAPLFWVEWLI
jgi:hypothetical protein